jgi:hypothetical protein
MIISFSCASNIVLTGEQRPSIHRSQVTEFDAIPFNAKEIGKVSVSLASSYGGIEVKVQVKKKAAKYGANGYVMTRFNKSNVGFGGGFNQPSGGFYTGEAVIFYVPQDYY